MIYQEELGGDNTDKYPLGGVVYQSSPASSMLDAIANPITIYGGEGDNRIVINQAGHSKDLYNYYWTSYSRGTDGQSYPNNIPLWHNVYLDGYIPLRAKSIYDPCPYLYRLPSNGTYNQFELNPGWTRNSYLGGVSWNMNTCESWFPGLGVRSATISRFNAPGDYGFYNYGTTSSQSNCYGLLYYSNNKSILGNSIYGQSHGLSVRCIEVTGRYAHTFCQQKVCKNCRAS